MWQPRTTTGTLDYMWRRIGNKLKSLAYLTAQIKVRETPLLRMSSIPMSFAPPEGQVEVALILIENGADVTAPNNDMDTP